MALSKSTRRFDVYWIGLDPAKGSEIRKIRPCIIVSPDEMNEVLKTVMVVPLTSTLIDWPFRAVVSVAGKKCSAACDQLRTISKQRLRKKVGSLKPSEKTAVLGILKDIFAN